MSDKLVWFREHCPNTDFAHVILLVHQGQVFRYGDLQRYVPKIIADAAWAGGFDRPEEWWMALYKGWPTIARDAVRACRRGRAKVVSLADAQ